LELEGKEEGREEEGKVKEKGGRGRGCIQVLREYKALETAVIRQSD